MALLQTAAAESEEKSDQIVTKFQEKEITIDEFSEQFMAARKEMHLRKLKSEKMNELIRTQSNNRNGPQSNLPYNNRPGTAFPLPTNFYPQAPGTGNSAPYPPMAYPSMPMPNQMFRHF